MILISSLLATFLTILVESFITFCLGHRERKVFFCVILVNLITHPVVCFFLYTNSLIGLFNSNNYFSIILLELIIVLIEFGLLFFTFRGNWRKWLMLSFLMNLGSYLLGFVIFKNTIITKIF